MTFVYGFLGGVAGGSAVLACALYGVRRALLSSPLAGLMRPPAPPPRATPEQVAYALKMQNIRDGH